VKQDRTGRMQIVREAVEEHIRWAERAADSALPPGDRQEIRLLCQLLAQRNADRPLQVGVFGQFSSGKSTLLNALLGAGLLPSAARVTTGVATRLWPAESDGLTVTLKRKGAPLEFGTSAFNAWYGSVAPSGGPAGIRPALREIMRSPRAAKSLDGIDIRLSGAVLGPDVVVIDTPGFDAADNWHKEVTERVAADVDLAIVLIPAGDPGAMSLARFLHEVLGDLDDRCVFVLTKFRQVPAAERADLQEHIVSWLDQQGFPQPAVLRADATDIAVAVQDGSPGAADGEITAAAALAETRDIAARLRTLAADRRQQLIEATLAKLLEKLLTDVAQAADERRAELQAMRERLSGVPIVDLDTFLRQWRDELAPEIKQIARRAMARARSAAEPADALSEACDEAVAKVGSRNDVKAVVAELLSETEYILSDWAERALRHAVNDSAADLARHAKHLKEMFTAQYADLAALTGADPRPPSFERSLPPIGLPEIDLSDAFEPVRATGQELQSTAYWKSIGGAATGAAIGTAIFPGVGTVVGGFLGAMAGSGRSKQQDRLRRDTEAMHDQAVEATRDAIWDSEHELRSLLKDAAKTLVARYKASAGPIIEQLTVTYHARIARLDTELRQVLGVLSEARRRRQALAEHGLGKGA
jgi:hypothetical protein